MSITPATDNREDEGPGLPGFQTWRGVYLLVLVGFAFWVIFLAALTRLFS